MCSLQHFIIYIALFNNRIVLQAKNGELDAKNAHLETKMSLLLEERQHNCEETKEHQTKTKGICFITCLDALVCRCVRVCLYMCAYVWVRGCAGVYLCGYVRSCPCVSVRIRA